MTPQSEHEKVDCGYGSAESVIVYHTGEGDCTACRLLNSADAVALAPREGNPTDHSALNRCQCGHKKWEHFRMGHHCAVRGCECAAYAVSPSPGEPSEEATQCPECGAPVIVVERRHTWPCNNDGDKVGFETSDAACSCIPVASAFYYHLPQAPTPEPSEEAPEAPAHFDHNGAHAWGCGWNAGYLRGVIASARLRETPTPEPNKETPK